MKKVFENGEIAVYSDKNYLSNEGRYLKFEDGSEIDLYDYTITNYGKGEIDLVYLPQQPIQDDLVSKKILVGSYKSIYCSGGNVNIKIIKSDVDDEYITVQGTEAFFNSLEIVENLGALNIYTKPNRDKVVIGEVWINGKRRNPDPDPLYGEIIINKSKIETFTTDTNGKGSVYSEVPIEVLDTKISGSFSMDLIEVEEAEVQISGSGDVKIGTLLNDSEFKISGSGKVIIQNGNINKIFANVSGSGDVGAMISVNEAYLDLTGSGSIVIDQVMKFSREKRGGSGSIKVLRRG
ncbi:GIN domain-containing protein [Clostridiisalibacter paucivorans]|uniref:GIN domain-containing protein n=1 Tax=Clostridiisalibacter paucivorans TaxID=408753 RepID=UPI0004797EC6|nr:DUF2807 domain-containing protein [Clostridiisalibacter paucivorans]